ncbi:MAG TPA: hypothetical protein DEQ26_15360 [Flavobacteriaceae bacterium]|nr:hypothetical protein [Flavobacteriaceae bacterium]
MQLILNQTLKNIIMRKIILALFIVASITSCKQYKSSESNAEVADAKEEVAVSNAANPEVEGKVFKSNALIEMKVKDAMNDAVQIEENAIALNGFVLNSEMNNQILDSDKVELSEESVKKIDKIQRSYLIELKVPSNKLREHVKFAVEKGIIIDHILINNEEMTFEKYENELKNENNKAVKISQQIENKVNKALINDATSYATIAYQLSEEPRVVTNILPQTDLKAYREINLGYELKQSWKDGMYYFKSILIIFCQFLPTILSVLFLFFSIKYVVKVVKNRETKQKI